MKQPVNPSWGYHDLAMTHYCGATPEFDWAGSCAKLQCSVHKNEETTCWSTAQKVMATLAGHYPLLQVWSNEVGAIAADTDGPPLVKGWQALCKALQIPVYPINIIEIAATPLATSELSSSPDHARHLCLRTACPYHGFVSLGLQLTLAWLNWSYAALKQAKLNLPRETLQEWYRGFERLATLIPPTALSGVHHRLWQQGISWEWLKGEKTLIGQGIHQRVVDGVPAGLILDDPDRWRIPIYTVTGSLGKTTTTRLLWQLLKGSGHVIALAASDGAWIGDQKVLEGDCIGGVTAQALLKQPTVQAAVFEQGRGGIINQGVPYARSDVAILLNVQEKHLGADGIDTLTKMADTKAVGLRPANLAVLNHDDNECRRIGYQRQADYRIWFSVSASSNTLQELSTAAKGVIGVSRDGNQAPIDLLIWQAGELKFQINLAGVAPYHGLLGEKTLEEILAAVAAAWFGPIKFSISSWQEKLRSLRLDNTNHIFRSSVHRQGHVVFVLDKAVDEVDLKLLQTTMHELTQREKFDTRIAVVTRSPATSSQLHKKSATLIYEIADEFICFDRPEAYVRRSALPEHHLGSIPRVMKETLESLNKTQRKSKLIAIAEDWNVAENILLRRLAQSKKEKIMVLVNQPTTSAPELNQQIIDFANSGLTRFEQ